MGVNFLILRLMKVCPYLLILWTAVLVIIIILFYNENLHVDLSFKKVLVLTYSCTVK